MYTPLLLNNRELSLPKAIVAPELGARTVLTNEHWGFVELALVREKKKEAQFFWQQAKEFYTVALGLPLRSAPLLLYYAFMNAAKTLLTAKGVTFSPRHGVGNWTPPSGPKPRGLSIGVEIKTNGVLPAMSAYYGETETKTQHLLKDILFNLPFVHRTFGLTYTSEQEMFVPLRNPHFVVEDGTTNVFFTAQLSRHFSTPEYMRKMPATLKPHPTSPGDTVISTGSVSISSSDAPTATDLDALASFAQTLRDDISYISGIEALWYVKTIVVADAPSRLHRQSTTLTLAAMHRLSEICRYTPMQMVRLLKGQENWLLSEFITMSGPQFIDAMAAEITGKQFLMPNVRPAT